MVRDLRPLVSWDDRELANGVEESEWVFTWDDGREFALLFVLIDCIFTFRYRVGY